MSTELAPLMGLVTLFIGFVQSKWVSKYVESQMHLIPKLYILFLRRLDTHVNTHVEETNGWTKTGGWNCFPFTLLHPPPFFAFELAVTNPSYPTFEARVVVDGNRHFDVGIEGLYAFGLDMGWSPPFRDAKAKWRLSVVTVIDRRDHPKSWGCNRIHTTHQAKSRLLQLPQELTGSMINTLGISVSSELHCRSEPLTTLEKKQ